MPYLAAMCFVLTLIACLVAFGGEAPQDVVDEAQYGAALFAFSFFLCLAAAYMEPPKP